MGTNESAAEERVWKMDVGVLGTCLLSPLIILTLITFFYFNYSLDLLLSIPFLSTEIKGKNIKSSLMLAQKEPSK